MIPAVQGREIERELKVLWEGGQSVRSAISPDGRFVALADAGAVRVFRFRESGRTHLARSAGVALAGAFSPDSRRFVFSDLGGNVRLADLGKEVKSTVLGNHPPKKLTFVAYSPAGNRVASIGGDQGLKVHDPDTGVLVGSRRLTSSGRSSGVQA